MIAVVTIKRIFGAEEQNLHFRGQLGVLCADKWTKRFEIEMFLKIAVSP